MLNKHISYKTLSLHLLRISIAIVFLAHALTRIFLEGSFNQFATFFEAKGWPGGWIWATAVTAFEVIGSVLLIARIWTRWIVAGLVTILLMGIVLIHFSLGWFVGEHGTGGCEYSFILVISLLVVAAHEPAPKQKG